jgi:Protein of unknown function (DUF2442)
MAKQKWELHKIKKVRTTSNFELICTFDDESVRQFDVKPLLNGGGPMIEPLTKKAYFRRVFLEMGVPTWPNGFDICADLIFTNSVAVKRGKRSAA